MKYKSEYSVKKMVVISILSGILSFLLAHFGFEGRLGDIDVSIPWSLIFPILVAIAFGSKYGLIAGLSGGAYFPFLLWYNNGIPNLSTAIIYLFVYFLLGLLHNSSFWSKQKHNAIRIFSIISLCIAIYFLYYLLLFNPLLSLNSVFGFKNSINWLDTNILVIFIIKESVNLIVLSFVATTLLELAWVRKLLGMPFIASTKPNNLILTFVIIVSSTLWLLLVGLGYSLLYEDNGFTSQQLNLIFFVILASSFVVSNVLFKYNEKKFNAERALIERETKNRETIELAVDGIVQGSPEGLITVVNSYFSSLIGKTREELLGKHISSIFSQEELKTNPLRFDLLQKGEIISFERKIIHTNGTEVPIEMRSKMMPDGSYQAIFRDITERKLAEAELIKAKEQIEESEHRLTLATKSGQLGIWDWNVKENTMIWDETMFKLYGITPESFPNSIDAWINGLHPEDKQRAIEECNLALNGEKEFNSIFRVVHPNGTVLYLKGDGLVLRDADQKPIRMIGINKDITEIQMAEENLLIEKKRLTMLLEAFPGFIYLQSPNYTIKYANRYFIDHFGEINDKKCYNVLWNREDICEHCPSSKSFETNEPNEWEWNQAPDGRIYHIYDYPFFDSDGTKLVLEIGVDITEQKQAEAELLKAKDQAEESDRLKSAFLANMSHEIRTPMNGILGFAELLKEPNLTGEEHDMYLEIIEKSGVRMLNIINDIVSISKIEAGLMKLYWEESNINEQIDFIYNFFKPEVEGKKILFSCHKGLPSNEALIKTDREKLYAILTNLVKNAIKYSEKGSIELGYTKKEKHLEFYVKDTGIGIPDYRQDAIFERFIQADITDKMAQQGAGLGLSISKAYVEMMGGKIWVDSEFGKGSTFYFSLPYLR